MEPFVLAAPKTLVLVIVGASDFCFQLQRHAAPTNQEADLDYTGM